MFSCSGNIRSVNGPYWNFGNIHHLVGSKSKPAVDGGSENNDKSTKEIEGEKLLFNLMSVLCLSLPC